MYRTPHCRFFTADQMAGWTGAKYATVRYHLEMLSKEGRLNRAKSYKVFYSPVDSPVMRARIAQEIDAVSGDAGE